MLNKYVKNKDGRILPEVQEKTENKEFVRKIKSEYWEIFTRRLDMDFYGEQKQILFYIKEMK